MTKRAQIQVSQKEANVYEDFHSIFNEDLKQQLYQLSFLLTRDTAKSRQPREVPIAVNYGRWVCLMLTNQDPDLEYRRYN